MPLLAADANFVARYPTAPACAVVVDAVAGTCQSNAGLDDDEMDDTGAADAAAAADAPLPLEVIMSRICS